MKHRYIILAVAFVILCSVVYTVHLRNLIASAEDSFVTLYAFCTPGSRVIVRRTPSKRGQEIGYLESGDWFESDGSTSDGWIRVYGIGESEGWVYSAFVVTEQPKKIGKQYVCTSNSRVACRKWPNGPKVDGRCWLVNGSNASQSN